MRRKIHVFTPYYLTEDFDRQKEIDLCLTKNAALDTIDRLFLLIDDGHVPPITSDKITVIATDRRPTYAQWIEYTERYSSDAISVLANSDIYFDETLAGLEQIFAASQRAFVALSRYEVAGETATLHKNPHWSQDVWAIDGRVPLADDLRRKLEIPLGVPRCDNKIGYIFSVHGYDIFNPCNFVRSYHLHETQLRSYDNHVDKRILGGTAWVHPSASIEAPSQMVFDIWTLKPEPVERIKVNDTIIVKEKQGLGTPKKRISSAIVAYDRNWQFPAITEQHAFDRLAEDIDLRNDDGGALYLAFPWATLIDNLLHNKKNPDKTAFLKQKLLALKPRLAGARTVVTTCQHIHMLRFQGLFQEMGVTDIFWSHAVQGQTALPEHPSIAVRPFPLYPVQAKDFWNKPVKGKKYLYSFIGAKANQYYLTQSRNIIIEELSKTNTGFVAGNDTWHYNKVVYDHQVRGLTDKPDKLVDDSASERFRVLLQQSVFSLCPSGTGPNSIRLWESIGLGSIPVIIADNLALPGDPALWEEAAVFCAETREGILALPERLMEIHRDPMMLKRKRHAMAQIWELYGIEDFVYDIRKLMLERSQEDRLRPARAVAAAPMVATAAPAMPPANNGAAIPAALHSLGTLTTEILIAPDSASRWLTNERPRIQELMAAASDNQKDIFLRTLQLRQMQEMWSHA